MYSSTILKHSTNRFTKELVTFEITYPRIIHSEMCRHRMFSRNTSSSRAIPFTKTKDVLNNDPFIPIAWQKSHKGMQGYSYFSTEESKELTDRWLASKSNMLSAAEELEAKKLTKQLLNRLVEPFTWTTEIVTVSRSELINFFELRCPKYPIVKEGDKAVYANSKRELFRAYPEKSDLFTEEYLQSINESLAEIHIQKIAEMMYDDFLGSTPQFLKPGEYHVPYGLSEKEREEANISKEDALKIAIARCARLSYVTFGDSPKVDYEADLRLYEQLKKDYHMSPFEHVARCMTENEYFSFTRNEKEYGWCSNFQGFIPQRYLIEHYEI